MKIKVCSSYQADIDEWLMRYPYFDFLRNIDLRSSKEHRWKVNIPKLSISNRTACAVQVIFIGKSGYGKSTTLNALIGRHCFDTNDISACTRELSEATYKIGNVGRIPHLFSVNDLPGIGESEATDEEYLSWYREMADYSDVIVYVLRADSRDFSEDEKAFRLLSLNNNPNLIIALNFADKAEPINRTSMSLSAEQKNTLSEKMRSISSIFGVPRDRILYYSAEERIHLDILAETIAYVMETKLRINGYIRTIPNS